VLTVGDLNIHGRWIHEAAAEDATGWLNGRGGDDWLTFRRLALTEDQAEEHNLLDENGKAEVDGLPVPVLDAILTDALDELLDAEAIEKARQAGTEELARLPEAIWTVLEELDDEGEL
jgi:hypothetical protein